MSVDYRAGLSLVEINGLPVACLDMAGALARLEDAIERGPGRYFCFCEANLLMHSSRSPKVARVLREADAVFADGIAVRILAALQRQPLPMRVSGPSFLLAAVTHGVERGWRHYFYGGAPGVADRLAEHLRVRDSRVEIVGTHTPPFRPATEEEERNLERTLRAARPDILWVALGSPKQELWVADHVRRLEVPVILPIGAAFDFHSGARPWAPSWVRQFGLEWAFRLTTGGPRTFRRNLACVPFVARMLLASGVDAGLLALRRSNPTSRSQPGHDSASDLKKAA